jgi:hypothetical protein
MDGIVVPTPEQIDQRIRECENELKSLRRLRRVSNAALRAEEAHQRHIAATFEHILEQKGAQP